MTYRRVLPRDLFNEANLLKCYGALWIALDNRGDKRCRFSEDDMASFDIVQRDDDGAIYVDDLFLFIGRHGYRLTRPLNSREPWPLRAEYLDDPDVESVSVFNDDGTLHSDFLWLLQTVK